MDISESNGAAPMQAMDQQKLNQTMMWQQNQYMGDSGIQSSVTTRVGSIVLKFCAHLGKHNQSWHVEN